MKKLLLVLTVTAACLITARAAISVGPTGSAIQTFPARPLVADGWSTIIHGGNGALITDATTLASHVNTNEVSAMTMQVGTSGTTTPSISDANVPRFNSSLF